MYDKFINLLTSSTTQLLFRIAILPVITILMLVIVNTIWLKVEKRKLPFFVHTKIVWLKSIVFTAICINIYWLAVIKFNGLYLFTWSSFSFQLNSIYLRLSPLFITYILLVAMYFRTQSKIKTHL